MPVAFLEAIRMRDRDRASRALGAEVDPWLVDELQDFARFRLEQLAVDPASRVWLGRAMIPRTDDEGMAQAVGSIGFHGPPDGLGRLEVGYGVAPAYRRRGFTREAVDALFDWAWREHGIDRFIASISPDNEASLGLAAGFGFRRIGEQMDPIDGLELVFETTWPPANRRLAHFDDDGWSPGREP